MSDIREQIEYKQESEMTFDIDNWMHCMAASITLSFPMAYIGTFTLGWFTVTLWVWSMIVVVSLFVRSIILIAD